MRKKVTFEGFQCDACGKLLPYNYVPLKFKMKLSRRAMPPVKDKMCLCETCAESLQIMITGWYDRKYSERRENLEKVKAMLAEEKE